MTTNKNAPLASNPTHTDMDMSPDSASESSFSSSHRLVVLGGGEAGLAVLHALSDQSFASDIALIEPSSYHYNQRAWMEVGTQGTKKERTRSDLRPRIPPNVHWIQDRVARIAPDDRRLTVESNQDISYEYLVIALGTTVLWDRIRGLKDNLGASGICSVYGYEQSERTWEMIRDFPGGRAFFTAPSSPHKGGTAPLQILREAESLWRKTGVREHTDLFFTIGPTEPDGEPEYAKLLNESPSEDLHVFDGYELTEVRPDAQEAVFSVRKGQSSSQDVLRYDLIHVVPPMRPPALLEESGLAHPSGPMKGYLEVDPASLRHKRFPTVFGVGDAVGVEEVKTAQRARKQAKKVAHVLRRAMQEGA